MMDIECIPKFKHQMLLSLSVKCVELSKSQHDEIQTNTIKVFYEEAIKIYSYK